MTYYFRVRETDEAGYVEAYTANPDGNTSTNVQENPICLLADDRQ